MPLPATTIRRLLGALEELGQAAEISLACSDGMAFLALQHRSEPLVTRLAALVSQQSAAAGLDDTLRARGQSLIREQHSRGTRLHTLLNHLRDEIARIDQTRIHARNLRPVYGRRQTGPGLQAGFVARG